MPNASERWNVVHAHDLFVILATGNCIQTSQDVRATKSVCSMADGRNGQAQVSAASLQWPQRGDQDLEEEAPQLHFVWSCMWKKTCQPLHFLEFQWRVIAFLIDHSSLNTLHVCNYFVLQSGFLLMTIQGRLQLHHPVPLRSIVLLCSLILQTMLGNNAVFHCPFNLGKMLKQIQKSSPSPISVTGHSINMSQHGFTVEPNDETWSFQCSTKKGESKATSGNAMRSLCLANKKLADQFGWLWRCTYDSTHCRLARRKPFLTALSDPQIEAGKTVKVLEILHYSSIWKKKV